MQRTMTALALSATAGVTLGPDSRARFDPEVSPLLVEYATDFRGDSAVRTINVPVFLNARSTGG